MTADWRNEQLDRIQNGTSVFKAIPQEIGKIIFCDSSCPDNEESDGISKMDILFIVSILITIFSWIFLYKYPAVFVPIVATLITFLVAVNYYKVTFNCKDYLLGENGFTVISYKGKRKTVTDIKTVLYDDISFLFTGGTAVYRRNAGDVLNLTETQTRTDYYFSIYGIPSDKEKSQYPLLYSTDSFYIEDEDVDVMDDLWQYPDYLFFRQVEIIWTRKYLERIKNGDSKVFYAFQDAVNTSTFKASIRDWLNNGAATKKPETIDPATLCSIVLKENKLQIASSVYDLNHLKYLTVSHGDFIIETNDLIHDSNLKHIINLWGLGNALALIDLLTSRSRASVEVNPIQPVENGKYGIGQKMIHRKNRRVFDIASANQQEDGTVIYYSYKDNRFYSEDEIIDFKEYQSRHQLV